jgi:hypothetical protein
LIPRSDFTVIADTPTTFSFDLPSPSPIALLNDEIWCAGGGSLIIEP